MSSDRHVWRVWVRDDYGDTGWRVLAEGMDRREAERMAQRMRCEAIALPAPGRPS